MEVYFVCLLHVCVCLHSKTDNLLYCVRVKGLRNFKAQTDPSPDVVREVGRYQVDLCSVSTACTFISTPTCTLPKLTPLAVQT